MAKLTKEEYNALTPYRKELDCARADYLRSVGLSGQDLMRSVYKRVTGEDYKRVDVCGQCELELMRTIAMWYFGAEAEGLAEEAPKKKGGRKSTKK